eukprot:g16643.t1
MKNDQKEAESMMKMKAILAECGAVEVSTTGRREGQDLDVAGLVETNMDATGEEDVEDWKIYHSGSKQREGVSLAVRRRVAHLVTTWRPVSGRLVYVDMKVAKGKPWRIIAAYAPTATKEHQKETEKFYRDLTRTVAGVSRWTVLGDMNARLPMGATDITGSEERGYTSIQGTQASGCCWVGDAEDNAIANGSPSASSPKGRSHQFANRESACIHFHDRGKVKRAGVGVVALGLLVVFAVALSLFFVCSMCHNIQHGGSTSFFLQMDKSETPQKSC